jgi:hypothetical protein
VTVAPPHELREDGKQALPFLREVVLETRRVVLIGGAHEDAFVDEGAQPRGEDGASHPETVDDLLEPVAAEHDVADDEERPSLTDDLEGAGDGAHLVLVVATEHVLMLDGQ